MHERYTCDLPPTRGYQRFPHSLRGIAFCVLVFLALRPGICQSGQEPANDRRKPTRATARARTATAAFTNLIKRPPWRARADLLPAT